MEKSKKIELPVPFRALKKRNWPTPTDFFDEHKLKFENIGCVLKDPKYVKVGAEFHRRKDYLMSFWSKI
jgi:hypothetical protein